MNSKKEKARIDKILVDKGLVSTRARAQAMIMAGHVLVNDVPMVKPGEKVPLDAIVRLREPELKYVSRGALKLVAALDHFEIPVHDRIAIDVGSSTGGFTEVLLERGVRSVHAIDVGTNQLAWKLRSDPRVFSRENYNARYFNPNDFPEKFNLLVMDVSFISLRLILPSIISGLQPSADLILLYKPQFELGREWLTEGGIVRDQERARQHLQETLTWASELGLLTKGWIQSPISGADGNVEYLFHLSQPEKSGES
ncbi:MAG: TlyA family RNA methyltransferase [Bdellovibrionales bacterium]|nr:TlyA family RNA methyltransferase [Bdellovibrionales bacterium]